MDQDEFAGRIFEIIERIETVYMHEMITKQLLWQLKAEFTTLFHEFDHSERVEVVVEVNSDNLSEINISFFQGDGGPILKELDQIYNCLIYDHPAGLRYV
jgi:hypothetical protein